MELVAIEPLSPSMFPAYECQPFPKESKAHNKLEKRKHFATTYTTLISIHNMLIRF